MSFTVGFVDPRVDLRLDGDAGRTAAPGSSGRVEQMDEQEGGGCGGLGSRAAGMCRSGVDADGEEARRGGGRQGRA